MTFIQLAGKKLLVIVEDIGLLAIAIATIFAFATEIGTMIAAGVVTLANVAFSSSLFSKAMLSMPKLSSVVD